MNPDRAALLAAVNKLVQDPAASDLYELLIEVIPPARRLGVRLTGEHADLNPLVDLAVNDPTGYANVMNLVEDKRTKVGYGPLDHARTADAQFDKTDYMRDFMQQKRVRERKAADIENLLRPEGQKLVGRSRLDFMHAQSLKWKKERDETLQKSRQAQGKLSRAQMRELLELFWSRVDNELDEIERLAREEPQKPAHMMAKK